MNDEQLAKHLRAELARLAQQSDLITVTIPVWMFKRMAEIVVGNIRLAKIEEEAEA